MTAELSTEDARVFAVIPAAGVGRRFGGKVPKQYAPLAGKPIIQHSIERLHCCSEIQDICVALDANDSWWEDLDPITRSLVSTTHGGIERADSVRMALGSMSHAKPQDWVLVHDAVRPLVDSDLVSRFLSTLLPEESGAILALPIYETVKRANGSDFVESTLDRSNLWTAQTPQVFRYGLLKQALEATIGNPSITDEASAMESCGHSVRLVEGHRNNIKITAAEDLELAERLLSL